MFRIRVFRIVIALAIVAGIAFRLEHIERRQLRADESATALRVSGHTFANVNALSDGREHKAEQILRFQEVDPARPPFATITGLASEEPHTAPLFFIVDRLWAGIAGSSIPSLRFPSVLASLAAIAAFYWLCFELTQSSAVSAAGAALMAVSPFFINYGAQARQYALWTLLIIVTSALLFRALRSNRQAIWFWYGAAMALALYTDPLTFVVLAAHGAYVAGFRRGDRRALAAFGIASLCALLAFSPWLSIIIHRHSASTERLAWTQTPVPLHDYLRTWGANVAAVLFDAEWAHRWLDPIAIGALALIVYSVYRVQRDQPRDATWFLVALAASALPLLLFDLVTGGHGSTIARFLAPLWVALLIYVAILFGRHRDAVTGAEAVSWPYAFGAVVAVATVSSAIGSSAPVWWDNHDYPSLYFGRTIDHGNDSLVLMNTNPNPVVLVVSHYVDSNTRFLLYPSVPRFPVRLAADTFALMPDADTLAAFRERPQYALRTVPLPPGWPKYGFYRIYRKLAATPSRTSVPSTMTRSSKFTGSNTTGGESIIMPRPTRPYWRDRY